MNISGVNYQYRYTFTITGTGWNEYEVGFGEDNFKVIEGSDKTRPMTNKDLAFVTKISFGMHSDGDDGNLFKLYVDNIKFDNSLKYSSKKVTPIA